MMARNADIFHVHCKDSVFNSSSVQGFPGAEESTQATKACLQPAHPSPFLLKDLKSTACGL